MKELLLGIVLVVLLGIGGFFYRNTLEQHVPSPIACTEEARVCPDGSAVGRVGPTCEFASCPFPNVALNGEIAFLAPEGYTENKDALSESTLLAAFEKQSTAEGVPHAIIVRKLSVTPEDGVEDDIIRNTIFETSDRGAESIEQFEKKILNGRQFYVVTVERFEAQIHTLYYLPHTAHGATSLYLFEVLERDVAEWTEPDLVIEELPEHRALLSLLSTLMNAP